MSCCCCLSLNKLYAFAVIIGLSAILFYVADSQLEKHYIFDPAVLQRISVESINATSDTKELFTRIASELAKVYPNHISTEQEWVFNNAGGAMGAMWILHSSISEYVIIFGTAIGTEGHTGRFLADDYFTILVGEQWSFTEGSFEKEIFLPGDQHHLPRGHAKQYRMPDKCFALEYARGWIPLMLPFGVADTLSSTLDFVTLSRTFYIYAKHSIGQLLIGKI